MDRIPPNCGVMALRYLLSTKHTVSFANQNEDYIRRSFNMLVPPARSIYGDVPAEDVERFARTLAYAAFGKGDASNPAFEEERFLELCYIFVICTFYSLGFTISEKSIADLVRLMKQPLACVRPFFKQIAADLWRMMEQS